MSILHIHSVTLVSCWGHGLGLHHWINWGMNEIIQLT